MSNDATNGYAEVNGLKMYYERHGDGPPLVLLHGAFGTIESCFAGLLRSSAERSVPPPSPSRRMEMLGSQQESVSDELE
jgi:hypothetical protein